MHKKKLSQRALKMARRVLGMPQAKKTDVWRVVAERQNVPPPTSAAKGYALLRAFTGVETELAKKRPQPVQPLRVARVSSPGPGRAVRKAAQAASDAFLESYEWRRLRMVVLTKRGAVCECCGASPKTGAVINVDHIKPRKLFPELALAESNLQVLCGPCNHGKGNWDQTDWRADVEDGQPFWSKHTG